MLLGHAPRVGGHILWPKINGNLQNRLLFFPSRRQNDREQASKTEMTNRERQGKKSWERSCVLERIDKKVTSECDVETFIVGWHKHTVEVLRLARHARCHREAAKGSAVPSSPLFLRPGFLLLCRMILFPSSSNKTHSLSCSTVSSSTHPSPSRSVVPTLQKNKKKKRPSSSEVVVGCRRTDSWGRIVNSPNRQTGKTNVTVLKLSLWHSSKDARLTTRCKKKVGPPPCSLMRDCSQRETVGSGYVCISIIPSVPSHSCLHTEREVLCSSSVCIPFFLHHPHTHPLWLPIKVIVWCKPVEIWICCRRSSSQISIWQTGLLLRSSSAPTFGFFCCIFLGSSSSRKSARNWTGGEGGCWTWGRGFPLPISFPKRPWAASSNHLRSCVQSGIYFGGGEIMAAIAVLWDLVFRVTKLKLS